MDVKTKMYKRFRKRLLGDLCTDGSLILKWILKKYGGRCGVDLLD
jgi:hypothetical protein